MSMLNFEQAEAALCPESRIVPVALNNDTPVDENEADKSAELPMAHMPRLIREMAELCKANYGVHCDLPVAMAMTTTAASIGKGVILKSAYDETPANIMTLCDASSGTGKSRSYKEIVGPLIFKDIELQKQHEDEVLPGLRAKKQILEAKKKTLLKKPRVENTPELAEIEKKLREVEREMITPRLFVEDCTPQKLAVMLQEQNEILASLSSDAGEAIGIICGRWGNDKSETEEHLFLKTYSGETFKQDRVNRGPIQLESPCLTVLWVVTPDMFEKLFSNDRFIEGGLLPRMLFCHSESKPKLDDGIPKIPRQELKNEWRTFIQGNIDKFHLSRQRITLQLSNDASEILREFHNEGVAEFNSKRAFASFRARSREQAMRIAISLHIVKHSGTELPPEIDQDTATCARDLVKYYSKAIEGPLFFRQSKKDDDILSNIKSLVDENSWVSLRILKRNGFSDDGIKNLVQRLPQKLRLDTHKPATGRSSHGVYLLK